MGLQPCYQQSGVSTVKRSRQTRSALPVSNRLLEPAPKSTKQVTALLQNKRLAQKQYYDTSSRPLQPLAEGQVVRMQTIKGHNRLGTVKGRCNEPRSYIIESDGGTYRRNCRHILPVAEPPPRQVDPADLNRQYADPVAPDSLPPTLQTPRVTPVTPQRSTIEQQRPAAQSTTKVAQALYVTRSGRICRPNPKYEQ